MKIVSGGESVNLDPELTSVKYLSNTVEYQNIYSGTLNTTTHVSIASAVDEAAGAAGYLDGDPVDGLAAGGRISDTRAFVFWSTTSSPQNSILDQGEHATLFIGFSPTDKPTALDKMRMEVVLGTGASLTVERQVPTISYDIIDLG